MDDHQAKLLAYPTAMKRERKGQGVAEVFERLDMRTCQRFDPLLDALRNAVVLLDDDQGDAGLRSRREEDGGGRPGSLEAVL